jgi:hypothetical protein
MAIDRRALRKSLRTNFDPGPRDYLNRALLRARQATHLRALATGGKLDRPIFIIGAPRSGTSMLYAILRHSPRLTNWPGEAHEVWEADFHPALHGWGSNALDATDAIGPEAERIKRSFLLVAGTRKRLIDKTPRNALRVGFIDALFPDARFLFLKRDGRDNINSLINAWRTPRYRTYRLPQPHSIPGVDPNWWKFTLYPGWRADANGPLEVVAARQWQASYAHALEEFRRIGPDRLFSITYEELALHPVAEVGRIMEFLELEYDGSVSAKATEALTKPVNVVTPPERGKWRKENPNEIEAIAKMIEPTMSKLGYEI